MTLSEQFENPKKYRRLTAKQMQDEPAVKLAEQVLEGIYEEMVAISKHVKEEPSNEEAILAMKRMHRYLKSSLVEGLSMGHGRDVAIKFLKMCKAEGTGKI